MVGLFTIQRGSVCWYDFGKPTGSEPAKRRPALVVQSNAYNCSGLNTTIVIPLTSKLEYAEYSDNVFISAASSGLDKDSVALTFQIITVNKSRLEYPVGQVSKSMVSKIESGLVSVLGLG